MENRAIEIFLDICKIPHGSGNSDGIVKFCMQFALSHGLDAKKDKHNNVVITKPASVGCEKFSTIVLQAHTDMVCEQEFSAVKKIDFLHEPITPIIDGDIVSADTTTLGADDGIGVAIALALLESDDFQHPKIEVLLTSDEEIGMVGAHALSPTMVTGHQFISLDAEDDTVITMGCAGGIRTSSFIQLQRTKVPTSKNRRIFELEVSDLLGGHSGHDIIYNRLSAIKVVARLLILIKEQFDISLYDVIGGGKDNVITDNARAIFAADEKDVERLINETNRVTNIIKNENKINEPNLRVALKEIEIEKAYVDANNIQPIANSSFEDILFLLFHIPFGVITYEPNDAFITKNIPKTSNNIGAVNITTDTCEIMCLSRSSAASQKEMVVNKIKSIVTRIGGYTKLGDDYPSWERNRDSNLLAKAVKVYKNLFNAEPILDVTHAGVECGVLFEKIENFDCIAIGSNVKDIHTPKETASISSVTKILTFIKCLMKDLVS